MPIIINYKMCDMAGGCPCIKNCPNNAWSYSEKLKRPVIDNSKCNNCGSCLQACPARAVLFATTQAGLEELRKQIEQDARKEEEIFEERYNSAPVNQELLATAESFKEKVLGKDLAIVEFFHPRSVSRCRINSVLFKEFLPEEFLERIVKIDTSKETEIAEKYSTVLPQLVFFKNGKVIGSIEGLYLLTDREILKKKVKNILNPK